GCCRGGVPSAPTPLQPVATSGSDTTAASTPRRVASRTTGLLRPPARCRLDDADPHPAVADGAGTQHATAPALPRHGRPDPRRRSRRVGARRGTGNTAARSGYARTRQATAQVGDEREVVMRAESGYGSSRPGRARGAGAPAAPRPGGRHDLDPAKLEALLEPI